MKRHQFIIRSVDNKHRDVHVFDLCQVVESICDETAHGNPPIGTRPSQRHGINWAQQHETRGRHSDRYFHGDGRPEGPARQNDSRRRDTMFLRQIKVSGQRVSIYPSLCGRARIAAESGSQRP